MDYAFRFVFFEYFYAYWALLILFFLPRYVLGPVSQSFTVSNYLWLKTSKLPWSHMYVSKAVYIIAISFFITLISLFWVTIFSFYHSTPFYMLIDGPLGVLAYSILVGSLILLFRGNPNDSIEKRHFVVLIALFIPIVFSLLAKRISGDFGGVLPFAGPVRASQISYITKRGSFSAVLLGLVFIAIPILRYYINERNEQG